MSSSASPDEFEEMLAEALDVIDRGLADGGAALTTRPLTAARYFVRHWISEVKDNQSEDPHAPGEFADYFTSEWFKVIYARTVAWYRNRYGAAMDREVKSFTGCIPVLGTAFLLEVPTTTTRPGTPGETIWIGYPEKVEDDEDALQWLQDGPNIASLPRGDGLKARRLANEIGTLLRAIHVNLATVEITDMRVGQLRDQILNHLEGAAVKIVRAKPEDLKHAQWDLQMACELSLKMLAQQRNGEFAESHDLYHLFDQLPLGETPFDRQRLSQIPTWERMAEWRYGGGPFIVSATAFSRYKATLKIVLGVARVARRKIRIGGASIEIRRAPFLHDDPEMFKPKSA